MGGKVWILLIAAALVSACAKAPPVPVDHFYRIPEPRVEAGEALTGGTILVKLFKTDGVHNERAVLYSEDENALALEQHHYHFWVDSPPRLLQGHLVDFLRAAKAAPVVVADPDDNADIIVSGRIKRFERHLEPGEVTARVALEMRIDAAGQDMPVLIKDYSADVAADGTDFTASITAFDEGVNHVFAAFLKDSRERLNR